MKAHIPRLKSGPLRKVLALDGSPRSGHLSTTSHLLDKLVQGMRSAGADVEVVELRKKKIAGCLGCVHCWFKDPGKCVHDDDMSGELFEEWRDADLVVYATPIYHLSMSSLLKTFVERTLPALEPWIVEQDGTFFHPPRYDASSSVVLSVCGLPSMEEFGPLSVWARTIFGRYSRLLAEIYRTESEVIVRQKYFPRVEDVLKATVRAGREIIETGRVAEATMARIRQPIVVGPGAFSRLSNVVLKSCLDAGLNPKEYQHRGLGPRPRSIEDFIFVMELVLAMSFRTGPAATIQFKFQGQGEGRCFFKLAGDKMEGAVGEAENPELTIESPFEIWMDIMAGRIDARLEFQQGRCKAIGDRSLLKLLAGTGSGG